MAGNDEALRRLYRVLRDGPRSVEVLADRMREDDPPEVRYFVEHYDGDDFFALRQGDHSVVVAFEDWEALCVAVTGAVAASRATTEEAARDE